MKKPVFIIGCPRSGTSKLLDLLSAHENFAWISSLSDYFPKKIPLNFYNKIYDIPLFGKYLFLGKNYIKHILPTPSEPWRFWNTYLSKFQWKAGGDIPLRSQTKYDINYQEINNIHKILQLVCKYQNKDRFISKYTNIPRINYLLQVFPDAQFIHILRDGRAVANSYYKMIKSGKFETWNEREWWIRAWPEEWRNTWREKYRSPISFVAYQWKYFLKEIWEESKFIPNDQYLEVRYEKIMRKPKNEIQNILEFCDLGFSSRIEWYLKHTRFTNMNYKWKNLKVEQIKELKEIIVEEEFKKFFEK